MSRLGSVGYISASHRPIRWFVGGRCIVRYAYGPTTETVSPARQSDVIDGTAVSRMSGLIHAINTCPSD